MSRRLVDTNIVSELIKPRPNALVVGRVATHELVVPAPVWHELLFGLERTPASAKRTTLEEFLSLLSKRATFLPYDAEAAAQHARERARLERLGRTPAFVDGTIAAIAVMNDLPLATRNLDDFRDFEGLRVENWFV